LDKAAVTIADSSVRKRAISWSKAILRDFGISALTNGIATLLFARLYLPTMRAEARSRPKREFAKTRNHDEQPLSELSARLTAASGAERVDHVLGPDPGAELLRSHEPQPERRIAQRQVLAIRRERDLRGLLVPAVRVERR
jgi:hypothetical protein